MNVDLGFPFKKNGNTGLNYLSSLKVNDFFFLIYLVCIEMKNSKIFVKIYRFSIFQIIKS